MRSQIFSPCRTSDAAIMCVLCLWLFGGPIQPIAAVAASQASGVVFDVDFTQGLSRLPPGTKVLGGLWQEGWRVTDNGQRIVLDAGRSIRNGRLEVTMTRHDISSGAVAFLQPALHWRTMPVGLYELETLGKAVAAKGDSFRIQVGNHEQPRNIQGVVRARVKENGDWRWLQEYGKWTDWVCDDRAPMTVKLEWQDGAAILHDITGKTWPSPTTTELDNLRYVALGGDNETVGSSLGVRFLRARLIDYDQVGRSEPPSRCRTVFDVDLKNGEDALPTASAVLGGQWDDGWRVTGNGQRIVLDAGYLIGNGRLEVTMTRKRAVQTAKKINVFGMYEHPAIDQSDLHGDIFYLRIGITEISQGRQGNVKAIGHGMAWEERFGKLADWVMDDKTPVTMKMEWKDGNALLTEITGRVLSCPDGCGRQMNALRYVVLGGDRYDGGGSLVGLRFLSVKLTDLDVPEP